MTKRKFTPPTEFPAEYVDGKGNKAVILGRGPHEVFPFVGHDVHGCTEAWTRFGQYFIDIASGYDLHDIPKPQVKAGELERIVWAAMVWAHENHGPDKIPEYTDGGNSFAEIECRAVVRRVLACLETE